MYFVSWLRGARAIGGRGALGSKTRRTGVIAEQTGALVVTILPSPSSSKQTMPCVPAVVKSRVLAASSAWLIGMSEPSGISTCCTSRIALPSALTASTDMVGVRGSGIGAPQQCAAA